jgi:hypothetical protein
MRDDVDTSAHAAFCEPVPPRHFFDALWQTGFVPEAYRDAYSDFTPLNWGPNEALGHWLSHGLDERRDFPIDLDGEALVFLAAQPVADRARRAKLLTALGRHLFDGTGQPCAPAEIRRRWPVLSVLRGLGARPYFVAGDSHSNHFSLTGARGAEWLLPVHLLCTGGSAAGLGNPASLSGYGALLRDAVGAVEALPGSGRMPFLVQFGQVDIEFVYHFRRVRDNATELDLDDYRRFCDGVVQRYLAFMAGLFEAPRRGRVCLVSVFPPALSDAAWAQGYVNEDISRRESPDSLRALSEGISGLRIADLRQRTAIHLHFNDRLRAGALRMGFGFADAAAPFLGRDGTIDPRFLVPEANGNEHHLDSRRTYDSAVDLVWRCLDAAGPPWGRRP